MKDQKVKLYKFQKKAVKTRVKVLKKFSTAYLAGFPGSGKTLMSFVIIKKMKYKNVVVLCPRILKDKSWGDEINKWVPMLGIDDVNFTITTYESVHKLNDIPVDLVIMDEVTKLKSDKSKRTKNTFKFLKNTGAHRLYLSGTPLNRPYDLWPILKWEKIITDWMFYIKRYCAAVHTGFGWDTSGASNVDELAKNLYPWMHIISEDSLDLPKVTEKIFLINKPGSFPEDVQQIMDSLPEVKTNETKLFNGKPIESVSSWSAELANYLEVGEISRVRKGMGVVKASSEEVLNYIQSINEPLVIFAQHREVFDYLEKKLDKCGTVYGGNSKKINDSNIQKFKDGDLKYIVLSLYSASEGLTLINSRRVFFIELPWNYTQIYQALKRVHRIGQERDVLVEYCAIDGILDAMVARSIIGKKKTVLEFMKHGK